MASPITQKPVNREVVRILAIEHGLKKAAELSNVNYETVKKWSQRHHWNIQINHSQAIVPTVPLPSPADALAESHKANKLRSKTALGKWAADAAEEASEAPRKLKVARQVRDVAAVHQVLWPEDQYERGILNLNVLAGGKAMVQVRTDSTNPD